MCVQLNGFVRCHRVRVCDTVSCRLNNVFSMGRDVQCMGKCFL